MSLQQMLNQRVTLTTYIASADGMGGFSATTATSTMSACIEQLGGSEIIAGGKITDTYSHVMYYDPVNVLTDRMTVTDADSVVYRVVSPDNAQRRGKVGRAGIQKVMA